MDNRWQWPVIVTYSFPPGALNLLTDYWPLITAHGGPSLPLEIFAPLLQYLISGLTNGAIYALIALGFGIIYNATTIINFAQGEMVMLGALCAISIYQVIPSLPLAFAGAVVLVTLVGLVFERLALRPVKDPSPITLIIITVGGAVLIKGVAMLLWGKEAYTLPPFSGNTPIHLGEATILPQNLWVLGITAISVVALEAFFRLTLGVYDMGTMLGLKGFSAAIIGGLGSLAGGVLGGLVLGVAEALATGFISSGYRDAVAFLLLLLVLFLRPQGLVGGRK